LQKAFIRKGGREEGRRPGEDREFFTTEYADKGGLRGLIWQKMGAKKYGGEKLSTNHSDLVELGGVGWRHLKCGVVEEGGKGTGN
jgi:hypothetical protein